MQQTTPSHLRTPSVALKAVRRVALVDNDVTRGDAVAAALRNCGLEVQLTPNEARATRWALLRRFDPDAFLVDRESKLSKSWLNLQRSDSKLKQANLVAVPFSRLFNEASGSVHLDEVLWRFGWGPRPAYHSSAPPPPSLKEHEQGHEDQRPTLAPAWDEDERPTLPVGEGALEQLAEPSRNPESNPADSLAETRRFAGPSSKLNPLVRAWGATKRTFRAVLLSCVSLAVLSWRILRRRRDTPLRASQPEEHGT